ncbi:hypothetical protein M7I_4672 [Glarea lozoyensis 74030]|uniref:Uncharacterized protein n=1 Tax=Glarea lozoyensis (strain ATCC 74030 / MF5533) TaxID=1104152 RepID=H0EPT5_GLAL7|nr:hypothetical protein M7I_4672 [Glarea lozoyensis 74030]
MANHSIDKLKPGKDFVLELAHELVGLLRQAQGNWTELPNPVRTIAAPTPL